MSTERHLPKKRTSITIDAEAEAKAENATADTAAGPIENLAETSAEPAIEPTPVTEPVEAKPAPAARNSTSGTFIGGFVGSALAFAGFIGLQSGGFLPAQNTADSTIVDRLSTLEANIASGTTSEGEQVAALSAEIAALKDSVAALSLATGNSSIADRVTALEQLASMEVPAPNGADMTALASRLATLESKTSNGADNEALTTMRNALSTEMSSLKSDITALKSDMAARAADPGLAAAVAATALRTAVDRGTAFGAELENFAAVQPDAPAITALRNFAASGVPTRATLMADFEDAAQAMMAASEPVDANATLFDRLMESAKNLVKVRPIGTIEGDTPAARIARMGEALTKGDDAAFTTEFAALPASSRSAGAAFLERFNARSQTDALISQAVLVASPKVGG